ncbi:MAG: GTP 3',8-cyclase MoaA [Thaumarchaeota archaeon]|nr:MAG: GTP 3',8-cyclase MoaA [Nitrososphaerota archaeon]
MLVDRFGRPVKGLRISITSSCDLNCFFCHGEGSDAGSNRIMTPGEIERIVRVAMSLGVDSVKLTGGEPMMRPDILEIVKRLGRLGLSDLSMTTNGFRLADLAEDLRRLGLKRVNISFHSTRPERYARITGLRLEEAERRHGELIEAVKKAVGVGFNPVKLNVVVVKGVNDDELDDLVSFAESIGGSSEMVVQLIELVGCGLAQGLMESYYFDLSGLERLVAEKAVKKIVRRLHFRKRYLLPNGVWVEFVKPTGNYLFCMNDTRLRITHDGKFKPCLMRSGNEIEFLSAMRSGASDGELKKLFLKAVELREPFWKPPRNLG